MFDVQGLRRVPGFTGSAVEDSDGWGLTFGWATVTQQSTPFSQDLHSLYKPDSLSRETLNGGL